MINQPEPVFGFTIPYYTSKSGETNELFVSEKTYEKYLQSIKKEEVMIISGDLHPIDPIYGEFTSSLYDKKKIVIIIGTKDQQEYTNELLDIAIATELEKCLLLDKACFSRYLYSDSTAELTQHFIDDIQQTLEIIHITKRLKKDGYRIHEREDSIAKDLIKNSFQLQSLKNMSPLESEQGIFLLCKLIYLSYVEPSIYQLVKHNIQKYYPKLFIETEQFLKTIHKINLSTQVGQERAVSKLLSFVNYKKYVKKISIQNIDVFKILN